METFVTKDGTRINYDGDKVDIERVQVNKVFAKPDWGITNPVFNPESYIRTLEKEHRAMKLALEWCEATGHNDDCMFCGFKDRKIKEVLLSIAIK